MKVVSSTLDEISPPNSPIDSTDLVPSTDASNLEQQETLCLPTSTSWDDFLPDMTELFVESHIEDVRDIIDSIRLLFVEETTSCIVEIDSDTSDSASTDLDTWGSIDSCSERL